MRRPLALTLTLALSLAACSRSPDMDAQMRADLDAASAATMELAPRGPSTKVVSAVESKNPTRPNVAPARKTVAPPPTPRPDARAVAADEPVARAPVASPPRVQPPPPGGYKTVGEVIRNAPFPIKP